MVTNFAEKRFLNGEHLRSSSAKTVYTTEFKLYTQFSLTAAQKVAHIFLTMISLLFIIIFWQVLYLLLNKKIIKSRIFENYSKRRKLLVSFSLCLGLLHFIDKKKKKIKLQFCRCKMLKIWNSYFLAQVLPSFSIQYQKTFVFVNLRKRNKNMFRCTFMYIFQPSAAFLIETSHLICSGKLFSCSANQMTGFFMKCNTWLKWV